MTLGMLGPWQIILILLIFIVIPGLFIYWLVKKLKK